MCVRLLMIRVAGQTRGFPARRWQARSAAASASHRLRSGREPRCAAGWLSGCVFAQASLWRLGENSLPMFSCTGSFAVTVSCKFSGGRGTFFYVAQQALPSLARRGTQGRLGSPVGAAAEPQRPRGSGSAKNILFAGAGCAGGHALHRSGHAPPRWVGRSAQRREAGPRAPAVQPCALAPRRLGIFFLVIVTGRDCGGGAERSLPATSRPQADRDRVRVAGSGSESDRATVAHPLGLAPGPSAETLLSESSSASCNYL